MKNSKLSLSYALDDLNTHERPDSKQGYLPGILKGYGDILEAEGFRKLQHRGIQPSPQEFIRQDFVDLKAQKYLRLSLAFYKDVSSQSKWSFIVALGASGMAVGFFIFFTLLLLKALPSSPADNTIATYGTVISGIGGTIAGLVSGVCFYIYGVAASQFSAFHARLDRLQRYFMAESLCSSISQGEKDDPACQTREKLVKIIAKAQLADAQMFVQPLQAGSGNSSSNNSSTGQSSNNGNNPTPGQGNDNPTPGQGNNNPTPNNTNQPPAQVLALAGVPVGTLAQMPKTTLAQALAQVSAPILAQALTDANVSGIDKQKELAQALGAVPPGALALLDGTPEGVLTQFPISTLAQFLAQVPGQYLPQPLEMLSPNYLAQALAGCHSILHAPMAA